MRIEGALGFLHNRLIDMLLEVGLETEESDVASRHQIGAGANFGDLSE
jgi:hypothetical protein